jgi:hypothetical protein
VAAADCAASSKAPAQDDDAFRAETNKINKNTKTTERYPISLDLFGKALESKATLVSSNSCDWSFGELFQKPWRTVHGCGKALATRREGGFSMQHEA